MLEQDRIMSDDDLAILGMQYVAYVKLVSLEGASAYSVHAADGTEIAILYDRDIALATIRRHDMEPLCVH